MAEYSNLWLSLITFLPAIVALVVLPFVPRAAENAIRLITLVTCMAVLGLVVVGLIGPSILPGLNTFDIGEAGLQNAFSLPWIPSFDIFYFMALDGISMPLVVLTAFVSTLAMGASWSITKQVKGYCILFLLLLTGMLGVFMALDFFLFYVFWEVMLLPMYFLIGVWGGPRKEYAAIKFFLYTLVGSVLMLIAILMLYFNSDLRYLDLASLQASHVVAPDLEGEDLSTALEELGYTEAQVGVLTSSGLSGAELAASMAEAAGETTDTNRIHTFNIMALQKLGQTTDLFDIELLFDWSLQHWAFLLLFIGFVIKVPSVPVHTWLPDAHVEAPTPISMILAGVLLKMGGYGILRICYPICPHAGYDFAWFVCTIGVVSMVYGAYAALAQKDFKRLVAYSSVSHMGYVVLGLGVWSATASTNYNPDYWIMGVKGAMFQMIAHGVSSAGMFFVVGVIYDRVHHRNLNEFGGLYGKMPVYTALAMVLFFAGLGLPGLCGFIGEVFVVLSVWQFSNLLAIISAAVVVLTAGYILWAIQRVYLGAEYKGPHEEALVPINLREGVIAGLLVVFAIWFGVFPKTVLQYMDQTIDQQVSELSEWTRDVKQPLLTAESDEDTDEDAELDEVAVDLPGRDEVATTHKTAPITVQSVEAER